MSSPLPTAITARRDKRWPVMPAQRDIVTMPAGTRGPQRNQPRNGPPIEAWEKALIGRTRVRERAAFTTGLGEERALSRDSVRGNLLFVVRHAAGTLSRLPIEVIDRVDQILHDSTFKDSELQCLTRTHPSAHNMAAIVGRLNYWIDKDQTVTRVSYG